MKLTAMSLLHADQTIETERLLLRRITRADLPFYARIHALPDVARYLAHGNPRTLDETTHWLDSLLEGYRELQLGQVAVTRKSDGALLGRCGVSQLETEVAIQPDGSHLGYYFPNRTPSGRENIAQQELGYTFDQAHWGQGYAREAVRGMWEYLASRRPELKVVSLIHPENTRSIRLATSFGATRVDRVTGWGRVYDRYIWPAGNKPSTER
jgi:ribosomal-protein-alanine N-acetyltransferase